MSDKDTITLPRELVERALRVAEVASKHAGLWTADPLIEHFRAALAAPRPEPVAMFDERMGQPVLLPRSPMLEDGQFLYTAPPAAAPDDVEALRRDAERLREEVRNWKKSFVGYVYVKNEDYAELIGKRDALKTDNERLAAQGDALLRVLCRAMNGAEWADKHIHSDADEAVQNWELKISLPVPLSEPDKSLEAAFHRFVSATLRRQEPPR